MSHCSFIWHLLSKRRWETVNFFGGQKLEVCYYTSYLYINRICRFVGLLLENWLVCPLVIITQKYMRFQRNSKYFSHNSLEFENNRNIFYCPTSQCIFSGNNKNLKIAWHTLLASYLLSDTVQFVSRSGVTQRLVIQWLRSKHYQCCI